MIYQYLQRKATRGKQYPVLSAERFNCTWILYSASAAYMMYAINATHCSFEFAFLLIAPIYLNYIPKHYDRHFFIRSFCHVWYSSWYTDHFLQYRNFVPDPLCLLNGWESTINVQTHSFLLVHEPSSIYGYSIVD